MGKKVVLGIVVSLLILMSFALAAVPDIGKSGCVTYSQARANPSLAQKTDAELYSMGFCPDSDAPATTANSKQDSSGILGKSEEELSQILSSERMDLFANGGDYDQKEIDRSQIYTDIVTSVIYYSEEWDSYSSCKRRCDDIDGGVPCYQECDKDWDAYFAEKEDEYKQAIEAAYIEEIMKVRAARLALGAGVSTKGELEPEVNTNSDRGRDEFGRINPSIGGYLGDAYVIRSDGTKVIPGKELYLSVKDKVITGKDAKINIIFSNAGKINLGPNTQLTVGNALLDQYYLARGSLKSKISLANNQKLEINTPNAGIFIKGTEFIVDYNETAKTTKVFLNEGVLKINSTTYNLNLTEGYYCIINPNGSIDVKQLKSAEWNALNGNFYDDEIFLRVYAWVTLAVIFISAVVFRIVLRKAKKHDGKKDLGMLSILLGILGIIALLFPILGYPLSVASTTLAKIQKLRKPSLKAKVGFIIGSIGVILNVITLLFLMIGVAKIFG